MHMIAPVSAGTDSVVPVANSIQTMPASAAALEAGVQRFRPVLMTALAMVIGMLPMAFGLGEGGEQNAPLGRAVIGGLLTATLATLVFVPVVFALVHRGDTQRAAALPSAPLDPLTPDPLTPEVPHAR